MAASSARVIAFSDDSLCRDLREEDVGRAVPALRLGHDEDGPESTVKTDQAHVITDERAEPRGRRAAQVEGPRGMHLMPAGASIAAGAEPDIRVEAGAAWRVMAQVVPKHPKQAVPGNGKAWQKGLGLLANGDVGCPPVETGIIGA